MSFCSFEVHRVARSSTNEVNLKTISISSLLVLATETIQGKSTRKFHMYLATLPTLRWSTQRFVIARVHLRVRKARSCSYPTRTDQKRNRPRGTSSDRLPCDHISEITVPRSATKIATCLSGWRRAAERQRVSDFVVIPAWAQTLPVHACTLLWEEPSTANIVTNYASCLQRISPKLQTHFTVRFRTCLYLASEGDRRSPYSLHSWASSLVRAF